jgi:hypothetical protein
MFWHMTKNFKTQLLTNQYLTHYWPILNGTMNDEIGTANMSQGNLTYFTLDRFGNENSALALNGGYSFIPSGVYFDSPEFTISVWVYPQQIGSWSRIIDFGNGPSSDNILLAISDGSSSKSCFQIYNGSQRVLNKISSQNLNLNNWQFLTVTFNAFDVHIYLNGTLMVDSTQSYFSQSICRTRCYIGKSNWAQDGFSYSIIDDLRFYKKSLTQTEILCLMNSNSSIIFSILIFITMLL